MYIYLDLKGGFKMELELLDGYRIAEDIKNKIRLSIQTILDSQERIVREMIVIGEELQKIKRIAPVDIYNKVLEYLHITERDANNYIRCFRLVETTPRVALLKPAVTKELFNKTTPLEVEIEVIKKLNNEEDPKKITLQFIKNLKSSPKTNTEAITFVKKLNQLLNTSYHDYFKMCNDKELVRIKSNISMLQNTLDEEIGARGSITEVDNEN